ncbi:hypothetical protein [Aquibacillus sediminis]|uniref:hypothetical protein n=1 Tax=Aquibacillus sediminis TaxID=2574734 RepID=UPI0011085E29|nr:hypothetical protein [Aquibacillus sediminis]
MSNSIGGYIIFAKFKTNNSTRDNLEKMRMLFDESVDKGQSLKQFIQLLIVTFNKGENGLIVKYLRETIPQGQLSKIEEYIDFYNEQCVIDHELEQSLSYEYRAFLEKKFPGEKKRSSNEYQHYFLLFCLNYVFVAYSNRKYRKTLKIKLK